MTTAAPETTPLPAARERSELGELLRLSAPLIAGQAGNQLMSLVDTAMVGRLGSAALELAVEARPSQTALFAGGRGFRHTQRAASLAACGGQGPFALCAISRLGLFEVTGVGVDRPSSAAGLLVQLGPRATYRVPLGKNLGLLGHVDASYLLSPWVVRLDGAAIWSLPRFSTVAGIDVAIHFH